MFAIGLLLLAIAAPVASAASTMGIQPDGGIVLLAKPSQGQTSIVRLNPDGSPDLTFGSAGSVEELRVPRLYSLAIQPDSKIVAGALGWQLARYLPDGAEDPGFAGGGFTPADPSLGAGVPGSGFPEAILFRPDGGIVVGGSRAAANDGPAATAQAFRSDGTLVETVGSIPVFTGTPPKPWSAGLEDLVAACRRVIGRRRLDLRAERARGSAPPGRPGSGAGYRPRLRRRCRAGRTGCLSGAE